MDKTDKMEIDSCKHRWNLTWNELGKPIKECRKCKSKKPHKIIFENCDMRPNTTVLSYSKGDAYKFDEKSTSYGPLKMDFKTPFDIAPVVIQEVIQEVNDEVRDTKKEKITLPVIQKDYNTQTVFNRNFRLEGKKPRFLLEDEDKIMKNYIKIE